MIEKTGEAVTRSENAVHIIHEDWAEVCFQNYQKKRSKNDNSQGRQLFLYVFGYDTQIRYLFRRLLASESTPALPKVVKIPKLASSLACHWSTVVSRTVTGTQPTRHYTSPRNWGSVLSSFLLPLDFSYSCMCVRASWVRVGWLVGRKRIKGEKGLGIARVNSERQEKFRRRYLHA